MIAEVIFEKQEEEDAIGSRCFLLRGQPGAAVIGAGSQLPSGLSNRPFRGKKHVFLFLHLMAEGTACRPIRTSLQNLCVTLL